MTVPGWTVTGTPTVIEYGTLRRFPWPTATPGPTLPAFLGFPSSNCAPPGSGEQFFGGGPVATSTLTQTVDLSAAASDIDAGTVPYTLSGRPRRLHHRPVRGLGHRRLPGRQRASSWAPARSRPVTAARSLVSDRAAPTRDLWDDSGGHPQRAGGRDLHGPQPGTRQLQQRLRRQPLVHRRRRTCPPRRHPRRRCRRSANSITCSWSTWRTRALTDIVGSPNAPYLNSLINTYGYAIELLRADPPQRPELLSDPGRIRLRHQLQLPRELLRPAQPGRQHRGSGQDMGRLHGGRGRLQHAHRPIALPCLQRHLQRPRPRRGTPVRPVAAGQDLASPATAPNFVWFAADDATNMEGPTDTLVGIVQWALSQLTDSSVQRQGRRRVAPGARCPPS